ncbi:DUF397 domain-containing protein [Streptomyces sp. NPDC058637]|uniref:DUF397 domain-containing protein n=1 Tax=Streptomyces sp. NPDC058637 TaxID=3346569 RepID=UPI003648E7D4
MNTELNWFKSTYSAGDGGECVGVASAPHAVLVRDSKDVTRPHLSISPTRWAHFVRYAAEG